MILFLLMLAGLICRKCGILTQEGSKTVSSLVVNVANPAMILSAGIVEEEAVGGTELLKLFGLAAGFYAVLICIALLLPRLLHIGKTQRGTYQVMTIFSNIGFMGFPIISAVYGSTALIYATIFLIPYNILIYTYGIRALTGSGENQFQWKKICNAGVIACVLTLIIYVFRISVPVMAEGTVDYLANLTAPLSMMVIGASLADMEIRELVRDRKLLLFSLIKLLIIPLIGTSVLLRMGLDETLCGVCMILLAAPVGSMTAMLAQQYDGDYELASRGVAVTTILFVITMPVNSFILGI